MRKGNQIQRASLGLLFGLLSGLLLPLVGVGFLPSALAIEPKEVKEEVNGEIKDSLPETSKLKVPFQVDWLTFRANQLTAFYFTGLSLTGQIFWSPGIYFDHGFGLRGQLGGGLLKAIADNLSLFLAPEGQLFATFQPFDFLVLELGGGVQYWNTLDHSFKTLYTGNVHYVLAHPWFGFVKTLFAGYSSVVDYSVNSQVKLGAQFGF